MDSLVTHIQVNNPFDEVVSTPQSKPPPSYSEILRKKRPLELSPSSERSAQFDAALMAKKQRAHSNATSPGHTDSQTTTNAAEALTIPVQSDANMADALANTAGSADVTEIDSASSVADAQGNPATTGATSTPASAFQFNFKVADPRAVVGVKDLSLIPKSLLDKLVVSPAHDFPLQHGINETNITEYIDPSTIAQWGQLPEKRVYCFLASDRIHDDPNEKAAAVDEIAKLLLALDKGLKPLIFAPTKINTARPLPIAFPYIIANIPAKYADLLTLVRCWVFPKQAFFLFPEHFQPTSYVGTLHGIPIPSYGPSDADFADNIRANVGKPEHPVLDIITHALLAGGIGRNALDLNIRSVLDSIRISRTKLLFKNDPTPKHVLRLHIDPPVKDESKYQSWLSSVRSHRFITTAGIGSFQKDPVCNVCKVRNHLEDACEFIDIPGWPTIVKVPIPVDQDKKPSGKGRGRPPNFVTRFKS